MKLCTKCNTEKPLSEFGFNGQYRRHQCNECRRPPGVMPRAEARAAARQRLIDAGNERAEVIAFLVCSLAEYGEDRVVESCIRVLGDMTLTEVGLVLGLSRSRVQQIEERALRKLRRRAELVPELREAANG